MTEIIKAFDVQYNLPVGEDEIIAAEANIWATFYMTFNDENLKHMYSAFNIRFRNLDFTSDAASRAIAAKAIHEANIEWIRELKNPMHNYTDDDILSEMPYIKQYIDEYNERRNK